MKDKRRASQSQSPTDGEDNDDQNGESRIRACDFCHKLKMKCVGKESPPCERCKNSDRECTFRGCRRKKKPRINSRLQFLENKIGTLQSALESLSSHHRGLAQTSNTDKNEESSGTRQPESKAFIPPLNAVDSTPSLPFLPLLQTNNAWSDISSTGADWNFGSSSNPPQHPISVSPEQILANTLPLPAFRSNLTTSEEIDDEERIDEDILGGAGVERKDNFCVLAEEARLKEDIARQAHLESIWSPEESGSKEDTMPFDFSLRDSPISDFSSPQTQKGNLQTSGQSDQGSREPDAIDFGLCTEEEARVYYDTFMTHCLAYMPCFDPKFDTFDSLRSRSALCITTLIMIGAKFRKSDGAVSNFTLKARDLAESLVKRTLFTPINQLEIVQALVVLAAWEDTSWRPGGHALRMATDMGLHTSLRQLEQRRTARRKHTQMDNMDSETIALVAGARTWLSLYKLELEMSLNLVRPAHVSPESLKFSRELLNHPLSVQTDSRLVAYCELLTLRLPLHDPFNLSESAFHSLAEGDTLDRKLDFYQKTLEEWYRYWDNYYAIRGLSVSSLLRQLLVTGKNGNQFNVYARLLAGIHSKRDIERLPERRKKFIWHLIKGAEKIIEMCLNDQGEYHHYFRYANSYTHMSLAFAARSLMRMALLVPQAINLPQLLEDVEKIADLLTRMPGERVNEANALKSMAARLKRHKTSTDPSTTSRNSNFAIGSATPFSFPSSGYPNNPASLDLSMSGVSSEKTSALNPGSVESLFAEEADSDLWMQPSIDFDVFSRFDDHVGSKHAWSS